MAIFKKLWWWTCKGNRCTVLRNLNPDLEYLVPGSLPPSSFLVWNNHRTPIKLRLRHHLSHLDAACTCCDTAIYDKKSMSAPSRYPRRQQVLRWSVGHGASLAPTPWRARCYDTELQRDIIRGTRALASHIAVTTQCVRTSERKEHGVRMVLDGSRWFRLPQLETPRRNACPALSTPRGRLHTLTRSANACGQLLLSLFAS